MKRIILILLILSAAIAVKAQLPTYNGYTNINSGYQWLRGLFKSLGAPAGGNATFESGQLPRAGALYYDSTGVDSGFYVYTGTRWLNLSTGGGIDSTLASQGLQMSGDTVVFAGPIGSPGIFTNERTLNLNRKIMHWTNGVAAEAGGAFWQFSQRPYSPYQFISQDTVTVNDALPDIGRPLSGLYARRVVYFNSGIYKTQQSYGHYFGQTFDWIDSAVMRNDGHDYQQAVIAEQRYKPRTLGRHVIRMANGTGNDLRLLHANPTFLSNTYYDGFDGASTDTLQVRGVSVGVVSYLVAATATGKIRGDQHVYFQAGNLVNSNAHFNRTIVLSRQTGETQTDTAYLILDTLRTSRSHFHNLVLGKGDSTQSGYQFKTYGTTWQNGSFRYTDGSQGLNKILQSDANGNATWVTPASGGTVNSGNINTLAYYPATGTTVDDLPAITANRALISDANGLPVHSAVTNTTLGFLDATSSVQTQLNGKANTALDNLSSVAINTSLLPATDNTIDLGSSSKQWRDLYMTGASIYMNGVKTLSSAGLDLPTGGAIRTATSAGNTLLLQARDVDGAAYITFGTLTANNTPTFDLETSVTIGGNPILSNIRNINTTSPITGGGDLSADRTIAINNAAADATTKGAASFETNDFNATSGNVSIDYTNGQAASGSNKGFLTSADWTTFNNKATASITKQFMFDQLTVSGVSTLIPRYIFMDDFVGAADKNVGGVYFAELFSGTGANASSFASPAAIVGATGFGYGVIEAGTTATGKAILGGYNATNSNALGNVNDDYYFRLSYKNVIFNDLSDGTNTYKTWMGFGVDNANTNGIWFTYTSTENSGAFICHSYNNLTVQSTNTATTVVADTEYDLDIEFYNQTALFYINGTLVATHTTQVPAAGSIMQNGLFKILKSAGTTNRQVYVDAIMLRITHENDL